MVVGQSNIFELSAQVEASSAASNLLERLSGVVDFEVFLGPVIAALRRSFRGVGGRLPIDMGRIFKILVMHALYSLSNEARERQIMDRLSFQRFLQQIVINLALTPRR